MEYLSKLITFWIRVDILAKYVIITQPNFVRVYVRFKCLKEVEHKRTVRYRTNIDYKEQNIITNLFVQHRTKMFYLAS